MAFEQVSEASDFHCVTTWSRMDLLFGGVRLIDVVAAAEIEDHATHIMCYGLDGYRIHGRKSPWFLGKERLFHGGRPLA